MLSTLPKIKLSAGSGKRIGPSDLTPFFSPCGVAVIGASPKQRNVGARIVASLKHQGYQGDVVTVHSGALPVGDTPVVTAIRYLPESVDLAIAAVSASHVAPLLDALADRGIHHLIVISGGFSETGEAGEIIERQIRAKAEKRGIRIIGPNGLGVFSAPDKFNSFFLLPGEIELPAPGPAAIISQSGAFLSQILDRLARSGVGVHRAVNFGNRIDVGECELLEAFGRDPAVRVIGLYLESVQDGQRLLRIARSLTHRKPIVICKGGRGTKGQQAAHAHSAALAGSYAVFQTACRQAGIIEVDGLEALTDAIQTLSLQPPTRGDRVLVLSNGGGMGVFLTDLCEQTGLKVPEPSAEQRTLLQARFPKYFSFRNPVDLTGSGTNEQCARIAQSLLYSGEFDSLLLVLLAGTEGINSEVAPLLKQFLPKNVPVVAGAYGEDLFRSLKDTLEPIGIPVFETGERAARALKVLVRVGSSFKTTKTFEPTVPKLYSTQHLGGWLETRTAPPHEMEIKNLLEQCGIPIPTHMHVQEEWQLAEAVHRMGLPLVLKASGSRVPHKTEVKGLQLNLNSKERLFNGWRKLSRTWPDQIWVEQQVSPGFDVMVGGHRDSQWGPVLLFGTGGTYVELYQDIARRVLPATCEEIISLIQNTHAGKIIQGVRGQPPLALHPLIEFLKWTAHWMLKEPAIASIDFNPVRLYPHGLVVLDAKITGTVSVEGGEES